MRIGVESNVSKESMKNLKEGTLLWTAEYDAAEEKVNPLALVFQGYVNAPSNSKKKDSGVWGKLAEAAKNDKGEWCIVKVAHGPDAELKPLIHVTDLTVGVFGNQKDAITAFKAEMEKIVKAAEKALEDLK